ncbi:MAG TPA: aldolase/citrate lyase family protein [Alphaproteobacteria bacterium]|jgi:2-keto-3-deoxy-L-rhamnonate aldolase RhmA|nr:aldolase/citrate lyase family protein [Alphaproteobacteria bacterium]
MMRTNTLKRRLAAGGKAYGLWLHSANGLVAEAAAAAGYDYFFIDNEHGPGELDETVRLLQFFDARGTPAVVRVAWKDPVILKRVLDAGAQSVMIPTVETADEARAAVAACRFPPRGIRGFGPWREIALGADLAEYGQRAHEELLIICQIETVKALANIEAIAAVDGVDVLFIGPNDLSGSLGRFREFEHPDVVGAIERAFQAIRRAGKPVGIVPFGAFGAADLLRAGYAMLASASDLALVAAAAREDVRSVSAALGGGA